MGTLVVRPIDRAAVVERALVPPQPVLPQNSPNGRPGE